MTTRYIVSLNGQEFLVGEDVELNQVLNLLEHLIPVSRSRDDYKYTPKSFESWEREDMKIILVNERDLDPELLIIEEEDKCAYDEGYAVGYHKGLDDGMAKAQTETD